MSVPLDANAALERFQLGMRLESIFMPYARKQRDAIYEAGSKPAARFVHYTSAEAALKIIKSKRVWMRNTTCMTDYREVQHGYDMLYRFFNDGNRKAEFHAALDAISPNIAAEAISMFDQWWVNTRLRTYVASISEHDDAEDLHGRLSMWRAFGGTTARVAIVLSIPWYFAGAEALNVMFSPVAYLREEQAQAVIMGVIGNIRANLDFLKSADRALVVNAVFTMLIAAVSCLKHEGFHEEREWRVIYAPDRSPSPLMEASIEVVGGIPQLVYKLPLDGNVSDVPAELDLVQLFDRLIVGPSQYSWAICEAFVKSLTEIGVKEAQKRVCMSGIPIRS